ncbi:alpha/beta fold hydrolase [Catenulispora yoronensis]
MPQVPGVRHRYVTARGVRFHVAETGTAAGIEDATPIVLVHGFPQHWYAWRHVMPLLAARHRVLAVDLRGFGWTEAARHGYGTGSLADDVIAVLDELGIGRAAIVGHDWGGWVGFAAALRHPERVSALVSVNMTHMWPPHRRVLPNLWRMWHTAFVEHPPLGGSCCAAPASRGSCSATGPAIPICGNARTSASTRT